MAQQIIGVGVVANDGTGDPARIGGIKINENFTELYNHIIKTGWNAHGNTATGSATEPLIVEDATFYVKGGVSDPGDVPTEFAGAAQGFAYIPSKEAIRAGSAAVTQWATVGLQSIAMGIDCTASDQGCIALGNTTTASAIGAIAIGANSTASDSNATAIGNACQAQKDFSLAVGSSCLATATGAVAIGRANLALLTDNVAIGQGVAALGADSVGIGVDITCTAAGSYTVGRGAGGSGSQLNNTVANSMMIGMGTTTPTFTLVGGRVGVGPNAINPLSTLDVEGSVGYQSKTITSADSPYTLSDELVLLVDTTGADVTVNLPQISGVNRRMYHIKCIEYGSGASTFDVIIHPFAGDFIDQNNPATAPAATDLVIDRGDSVQLMADIAPATDTWWII